MPWRSSSAGDGQRVDAGGADTRVQGVRQAFFSCSLLQVATPASCSAPVWIIYCDGSALPNPGRMGMGAVLIAPDGTSHALSQLAPGKGCSNEAELRALMAALGQARAHGATELLIYCDSRVVVDQLGDAPGPPVARLAALAEQTRAGLQAFEHVQLQWIPRRRNAQADALARAALGMGPRRAGSSRKTLTTRRLGKKRISRSSATPLKRA